MLFQYVPLAWCGHLPRFVGVMAIAAGSGYFHVEVPVAGILGTKLREAFRPGNKRGVAAEAQCVLAIDQRRGNASAAADVARQRSVAGLTCQPAMLSPGQRGEMLPVLGHSLVLMAAGTGASRIAAKPQRLQLQLLEGIHTVEVFVIPALGYGKVSDRSETGRADPQEHDEAIDMGPWRNAHAATPSELR